MGEAVRAGDLDQIIYIKAKTVTRDSAGGEVPTWNTVRKCNASVSPMHGFETRESMRQNAELYATIIIRFAKSPAIDETMYVWHTTYGGNLKIYNIKAIAQKYTDRKQLELTCREIKGEAQV